LQLLEYLCKHGSERVIDDARSHLSLIRMLRQFHYIDQNGKDQGINVRNRSAELVKLLSDVDTIRQERKKARANKNKYSGVEGGPGLGGGFSSGGGSSRYGGFGSETGGYGGYQGEVYGDGGGFGGRETDYSGTQRRGDQFEEYDEADDADMTRPTRATATRSTPSVAAKKEPPKPKEPEQDLFDFTDEPPTTTTNGKSTSASSSALDEFGTLQSNAVNDDDDFDDFQSATPSIAQPAANPLAALSPPPTTSTTSTTTQFAAPRPLPLGQTAGFNNILSTASPAPSASSSIMSPTASVVTSPGVQKTTAPLPLAGGFTGPNYFTSVPMTSAQTSAASNANASKVAGTPSYMSSTSAASLGRPTQKPVSTGGGDVFGSLWSSASSASGIKANTNSSSKGPDLASMAKAKSQAGIWGAASAASSTPRSTGVTPPANSVAGQAKPSAPLGNGLDDLLG
jgi:epsin